jgi:hypothetical protein
MRDGMKSVCGEIEEEEEGRRGEPGGTHNKSKVEAM